MVANRFPRAQKLHSSGLSAHLASQNYRSHVTSSVHLTSTAPLRHWLPLTIVKPPHQAASKHVLHQQSRRHLMLFGECDKYLHLTSVADYPLYYEAADVWPASCMIIGPQITAHPHRHYSRATVLNYQIHTARLGAARFTE